jgi:hypothetical protein
LIITSCSTIVDLAFFHKDHSDATTELMTTSLIKTCGSSKRLLSSLAQNALRIVLTYTSWNPHYPNIFLQFLADKNQTVRQAAAEAVKHLIEKSVQLKTVFDRGDFLDIIIECIRKSLQDALGAVRELGKESYHYLQINFPLKAIKFSNF